ncbi:MAG: hypothetical protein BGO12_11305 [Verrucomicrobia bacterium 61-8]|mgnify:CR=1 FL=1|nr:hypothetical protein [Verrucomicrobiota bacterium]OJV25753.1 MAG: hypothetical protein BGO12_11305 [Verrucomicrobia bacterium 61-8]
MKGRRNVFDWASLLSLSSVLALILLGIGLLVLESIGSDYFSVLVPVAALLVLVFVLGVMLLWIEAWIWIVSGWAKRSTELNLGLILSMLIGPVFAAYGIHFFRRRRSVGEVEAGT